MTLVKLQNAPQPIDVADWGVDDSYEFGIYPEGARAKRLLLAPAEVDDDLLIGGHRYLFKLPSHRYPQQHIVEVAAYQLGGLCGVTVPPAFLAHHSASGERGALIEWFYDYPRLQFDYFYPGGDYMVRQIPDYDRKKGRQHCFEAIDHLCQVLQRAGRLEAGWREEWARMLVFDALISNTDRHHDNWGLVWRFDESGEPRAALASAFDNGTSMGHEIMEERIPCFDDEAQLESYIVRGYHHMRWRGEDERQALHADLPRRLAERYPETRDAMLGCLAFSIDDAAAVFDRLCGFVAPHRLSRARADFMLRLLLRRRERLGEVLT